MFIPSFWMIKNEKREKLRKRTCKFLMILHQADESESVIRQCPAKMNPVFGPRSVMALCYKQDLLRSSETFRNEITFSNSFMTQSNEGYSTLPI